MCALDAQQQTQVQELGQGEESDRSVALDHGGLLGGHVGNRNRRRGGRSTPPGRWRGGDMQGARFFSAIPCRTPHRLAPDGHTEGL